MKKIDHKLAIATLMTIAFSLILSCSKPFYDNKLPLRQDINGNFYTGFMQTSIDTPLEFSGETSLSGETTEKIELLGENLIFTTKNGFVYIMNPDDLSESVKFRVSHGVSGSPASPDHILYLTSEIGKFGILAYDLYKRSVIWKNKNHFSAGTPILSGNKLYYGTLEGLILCLDARNGKKIWEKQIPDRINTNLAFSSRGLITAGRDGIVTNLDPEHGVINWSINIGEAIQTAPVIKNDQLIVSTYPGNQYIIKMDDGSIQHKNEFHIPVYVSPSVDDDRIYSALSDGRLVVLGLPGGNVIWESKLEGPPSASPLITLDMVIVGTARNKLYLLDKFSGEILQRLDLKHRPSSAPIIYKNQLFIGLEKRKLAVFKPVKDNINVSAQ
ncbi:MAG: PQQ-binding-like beta-propeller repeat protein [Calditrichaceae bacterium]